MSNSKSIAGLVGPVLVATTVSEAINLRIFDSNITPVVYLNGVLLFLAGLSILRAHNLWTWRWPVLITLVGWIGIVGGLLRMFVPQAQQGVTDSVKYGSIIVLFLIGSLLTFKAYISRDNDNSLS